MERNPPVSIIQFCKSDMGESSVLNGNKEFESFLEERGVHSYLEFVWACKGMRALMNEDEQTNKQIVNSIYNTFITSGSLSRVLSNETLLKIVERMMHILYSEALSSHPSSQQWNTSSQSHSLQKTNSPREYKSIFVSAESEAILVLEKLHKEFCANSNGFDRLVCLNVSSDHCSSKLRKYKYHSNPEEFAKELSNKLEALELEDNHADSSRKRARIDIRSDRGCVECTQEKQATQFEFSKQLAQTIENRLLTMRNFEDNNFDRRDECRLVYSQSVSRNADFCETLGESGSETHRTKRSRRKRMKSAAGFMSFRECLGHSTDVESEEYFHLLPPLN